MKAYRLKEDIKVPSANFMEKMDALIKKKAHLKSSKKEWQRKLGRLMNSYAKKGEIFFRSKIWANEKGEFYLYPNKLDSERTLGKLDLSLGLNLYVETNKYKIWKRFLEWNERVINLGKFEEIDTKEKSFEEINFVPYLIEEKKALITKMEEMLENTRQIDVLIKKLQNDNELDQSKDEKI